MKYTGKQYVAIDNSYEINLSNPNEDKAYLAGTATSYFKVTTIVSEPFSIMYLSAHCKEYKPQNFVIVKGINGMHYMTLFFENGVITKNNTIAHMHDRHSDFVSKAWKHI